MYLTKQKQNAKRVCPPMALMDLSKPIRPMLVFSFTHTAGQPASQPASKQAGAANAPTTSTTTPATTTAALATNDVLPFVYGLVGLLSAAWVDLAARNSARNKLAAVRTSLTLSCRSRDAQCVIWLAWRERSAKQCLPSKQVKPPVWLR